MQREDPKNQMSYYCKYSKKSQEIFEKSIDGSIVQFGNSESITIHEESKNSSNSNNSNEVIKENDSNDKEIDQVRMKEPNVEDSINQENLAQNYLLNAAKLPKHFTFPHLAQNVHEGSKNSSTNGNVTKGSIHEGFKLLFKCKFCHESYSSAQSLSYHFNSFHKGSKKWICKYCDKTYTRNQNLKSHLISVHGKFSCECATCGITCNTSASLKTHIKIAHGEKQISVKEDSKDVHKGPKNESHECQKCGLIYYSAHNLLQHINYVHEGEKYACSVCKKLFTQPYSLMRHKRSIHEGIKSFSCKSCNERFTQSSSLKRHIMKAHGDITLAKIKEPNVDDSMSQDNLTTQNVPDQRQEKVQEISISQNVNEGKNRSEVKIDKLNVLENENDSVALKSETKFNFDQSNSKNIIENSQINKCDICGRSFTHPYSLIRHNQIVHEKLKPHKCKMCEKTFSQSANLKLHIGRIHKTDEVNVEKSEIDQSQEMKSQNVHEGSKNSSDDGKIQEKEIKLHFKCQFCSRHYSSEHSLGYHVNSFHKVKDDFDINALAKKIENIRNKNNKSKEKIRKKSFRGEHNISNVSETLKPETTINFDEFNKIISENSQFFKCDLCGKSFTELDSLRQHIPIVHLKLKINIENKNEPLSTNVLEEGDINVNKDAKSMHEGSKESHKCPKCGKLFSRSYNLLQHIKSAHEGQKYVCDINNCNKFFTQPQSLERHKKHIHAKNNHSNGSENIAANEGKNQGNLMQYIDGKCYTQQNTKDIKTSIHDKTSDMELNSDIVSDPNYESNPEEVTDDDDEEWKKYKEKWEKYLKDSTFSEPPKPKQNEIKLRKEVLENDVNKHFIPNHSISTKTAKEENDYNHENDFENSPRDHNHKNELKYDRDLLDILESEDLPDGWQEMEDNNGSTFYVDNKTQKIQREDPRISLLNVKTLI